MKKTQLIPAVLALAACALAATPASAALLDGEIGIIGIFATSGGADLEDATGLTFDTDATVIIGSGDFAAFVGDSVTFANLTFDTLPVAPLFTTSNGLSFTLNDLSVNLQTGSALDWTGTGVYSAAGFDDTPGTIVWTGDSLGGLLTFSASGAAPVPVPGTLLLFASALLGLRRKG